MDSVTVFNASSILFFAQSLTRSLDFIVDTASGDHPFDPYMDLLKVEGVLALVGFPSEIKLSPRSLNFGIVLFLLLAVSKLNHVALLS